MTLPLSEYPGTFLKRLKGEQSNSGFSNFSLLIAVSFRVSFKNALKLLTLVLNYDNGSQSCTITYQAVF